MQIADEVSNLPGEALVRDGLSDLAAGRRTAAACLVEIGRTRLTRAGIAVPDSPGGGEFELQLYALLRREGGDAYSRYNALLRELVSFENATDARRTISRKQQAGPRLASQF